MQAFLESDKIHNLPKDQLDELLTVLERIVADYQNQQIEMERRIRAYWDRRWAQLWELEHELTKFWEAEEGRRQILLKRVRRILQTVLVVVRNKFDAWRVMGKGVWRRMNTMYGT
jgi:hypothetical protein